MIDIRDILDVIFTFGTICLVVSAIILPPLAFMAYHEHKMLDKKIELCIEQPTACRINIEGVE